MPDSVEVIKRRYAEEAKTYRRDALKINFEAEKSFKTLLVYLGELFPDKNAFLRVLDIGAGTGMLSEVILKAYPNAHVTLLDNSKDMLLQAKSYFESIGGGYSNRITLCERDFITEEFPDGKYDLVLSSFALHHIRTECDLVTVFGKIYRALKPEIGTFFCIDYVLKKTKSLQLEQVRSAINQWERNGYTHDEAIAWAEIIQSEDTPANLLEILRSLYNAKNQSKCPGMPLISPFSFGNYMTAIYGFTFVKIETLMNNNCLKHLLKSWRFPEQYGNWEEHFSIYASEGGLPIISPYPVSDIIDGDVSRL